MPSCNNFSSSSPFDLSTILMLSANMKGVVADEQQGKSFIYKMNKSDPSMLPCGTPDITGSNCGIDWLIFTH